MTDTRERGKVDFQDLAKLATLPVATEGSSEEKKENSGIIHLSALAAGEAAATEAATEKAETARKSVPPPKPPPRRETMRATPVPQDVPAPVQPRPTPLVAPASARSTVWMALAAGIALGALAAGLLFGLRARALAKGNPIAATSSEQAASANASPKASSGIGRGSAPSDRTVELSALPQASEPHRPSASAANMPPVAAATPPANSAAKPGATVQTVTAPSGASPTPSGTAPHFATDEGLEALMKRAVGSNDHAVATGAPPSGGGATETTSSATGGLPAKPAMGAVQGALGTVMPAARYCLGPDDPVSRATITFKSDGSVQTVSVTGDAAGQPAEGCIRSRLMAARVPPFASPSFTWTVTVRPAN